jgi:hypothetical protein
MATGMQLSSTSIILRQHRQHQSRHSFDVEARTLPTELDVNTRYYVLSAALVFDEDRDKVWDFTYARRIQDL